MAADTPSVRRSSLRFRITALATLVVFVVLAATAIGLVVAQRRSLTSGTDAALTQRADDLEAVILVGRLPEDLAGGGEESVAQVVVVEGDADLVIAASGNLFGVGPVAGVPPEGDVFRTFELTVVDDEPFRMLSRRIDAPAGVAGIHVGVSLDGIEDSVAALISSLVIAIPLVVAALAALVWWVVGRALAPVEAIRTEVAAITGAELHRRVPVPETDDEIARLAVTMNDMLARVEDATERQQRFVADASHELRSPLTRIRSEVEVDLAHPETADFRRTHESVVEETEALVAMLDDLLHLARSDAGAAPSDLVPVDLVDTVRREVDRIDHDGIAISLEGEAAVTVRGHAAALARAVRNLLDNAVRHADGSVTVAVAAADGVATLRVDDDGPGIPLEVRDQVFDRFARLDEARTRSEGGTGLGLAIVKDIVERHGGSVRVDGDYTAGTRIVVELPS